MTDRAARLQSLVTGPRRPSLVVTLAALFLSGVAGVANQVLWQRALKVFLGGSETLSAMIVVLVFMLGLGIGSAGMAARARRLRHPLRAFALIELALAGVNGALAALLSLESSPILHGAERLVVDFGIPVRLVFTLGSLLLLLPPTLLMGATLPVASEGCQRQLGASDRRLIVVLFVINALGAVLGAFGSSLVVLPLYGQSAALTLAASMNAAAACVLLLAGLRVPAAAPDVDVDLPSFSRTGPARGRISLEEGLGAVLGFLALGYEMLLFRMMALAHDPLPYTFATTLCFYLLFWSVGVFAASRLRDRLAPVFASTAVAVALVPSLYWLDRYRYGWSIQDVGLAYFLPCIGFGLLYGALVSRRARSWGRDVGRFHALNTAGSCLGILFFTLVGYEIRQDFDAWLIALGLFVLLGEWLRRGDSPVGRRPGLVRGAQVVVSVVAVGLLVLGLDSRFSRLGQWRIYWGRDGVVEVDRRGNVLLDGLWHTRLSNGRSHVGDQYTWGMAVGALLGHGDEPIERALVVGNGVGLTASTLAQVPGIEVVAYEINHTLASLIEDFPGGSLRIAERPNVEIRWRDARGGLSLDESLFDVIVSAPLHLKQAGSSQLLSVEYLSLVKSRLAPGGIVAIYSREGSDAQTRLVQRTVAEVFPHTHTLQGELVTLASTAPIEISPEALERRLARMGPGLRAEVELFLRRRGEPGLDLYDALDPRPLPDPRTDLLIRDDHPLLEYPDVLDRRLETAS